MDGRTHRRTNEQTGGQTNGWIHRRTGGRMRTDRRMDGQPDGPRRTDRDAQTEVDRRRQTDGDGLTDGRTGEYLLAHMLVRTGGMDKRMDRQTDGRKDAQTDGCTDDIQMMRGSSMHVNMNRQNEGMLAQCHAEHALLEIPI